MPTHKCEEIMANESSVNECLFPKHLVLPTISSGQYATTDGVPTGSIFISGNEIVWFDGTAWQTLSGSNSGDA